MLRVWKWKAKSVGTWEMSWVYDSVAEEREGVGPYRIIPKPQQAYWSASYGKAVLPSAPTDTP